MKPFATAVAGVVTALLLAACTGHADPGATPDASPRGATSPTPSATPTPQALADLAEGPATTVPFWDDGVLHVGERTVDLPEMQLAWSGGTTLVGLAQARGSVWSLVDGDGTVPVAESDGLLEPVLSADGSKVAWSSHLDENTRELGVWDVATRTLIATRTLDVQVVCCDGGGDIYVLGVMDDGRVFFHDTRSTYAWRPGAAPVKVMGLGGLPYSPAWPGGGVMYQGRGATIFETPGVFGSVDERGRFHRVGRTATDQLGMWSPDGTAYAYLGDDLGVSNPKGEEVLGVWVEWPTGRTEPVRMGLPTDRRWEVVAWEDADHVVLTTGTTEGPPTCRAASTPVR